MTGADDDIETMSEDKLLSLPSGSVPPGLLTLLWSRHADILHQRSFDEYNLELSGVSSRRWMLYPGQSAEEKRRIEEEEACRRYAEAMLDVQSRSDRLLADIEIREKEIEKRQQEIEDRALKLHDGRRVYFDGSGYRDETGRALAGSDATEAEVLHRERPDAPTWQERQKTIDERDEMERLREKVLKEQQQAQEGGQDLSAEAMEQRRKDAEQRMTGYEREFAEKTVAAKAEIEKQPDIAAAYDSVSLGDYAGPAGGEGRSSAPDFTRAVAGLIATAKAPEVVPATAPDAPKVTI
ncbi:MAG TPA: hypothetical protein VFW44_10400 [Bryobacteraceae bacterium]|nr:hypothetical protein [Bryobacteraceae bacterium]